MWARIAPKQLFRAGLTQLQNCNNAFQGKTALSFMLRQQNHYCSEKAGRVVTLNPSSASDPYPLTKEQIDLITGGDPAKDVKLAALKLRLYTRRERGILLPPEINLDNFDLMLNMSEHQLSKMMRHLTTKYNFSVKKADKQHEYHERLKLFQEERDLDVAIPWLDYRLHGNSLFPRLFKSDMNRYYDAYALKTSEFAQKIVIDCSYDSYMDDLQIKYTAKQIAYCHSINRKCRRPFSLHVCNIDPDSRLMFYLNKVNPVISFGSSVFFHSCSYLELFDQEDLVYLSPHARKSVVYNPNHTYILGAIVDKHTGLHLTNRKAAKEKTRSACLPLDKYLSWEKGSKSLCVHQCLSILLDVQSDGDMASALLKHVPRRKIKTDEIKSN